MEYCLNALVITILLHHNLNILNLFVSSILKVKIILKIPKLINTKAAYNPIVITIICGSQINNSLVSP